MKPELVDLTETAPGEWSFVRLLRLAGRKRAQREEQSDRAEAEARKQRFFDSLGDTPISFTSPTPWYDRWPGMALFFGGFGLIAGSVSGDGTLLTRATTVVFVTMAGLGLIAFLKLAGRLLRWLAH